MQAFEFLKGLIFLIPELAVLAGCIYYLARTKTTDGVLMTIGSAIGLCVMVFFRVIYPLMTYNSGYSSFSDLSVIFDVIGIVGFVGSVLFAVGLILLLVKAVKDKAKNDSPFNI